MKTLSLKVSTAVLAVGWLTACSPELPEADGHEDHNHMSSNVEFVPLPTEDRMVLGDRLPNPYTEDAISEAYQNLIDLGEMDGSEIVLSHTHNYVRFLPKTEDDWNLLMNHDENEPDDVIFIDYPIDYEIIEDGNYYHDPALSEEGFTYQYGVIPASVDIVSEYPGVDYIILAKLTLETGVEDPLGLFSLIEEQSFKNKGLWSEERFPQEESGKSWFCSKYYPSGTIQYTDNVANTTTPLEGVKVFTHNWFVFGYAITNASGQFNIPRGYCGTPRYRIKWERSTFTIRQGYYWQAYTRGPEQRSAWNFTINTTRNRSFMWATVHIAAHEMYYRNIFGLDRPPGSTANKVKIGTFMRSGRASSVYDRTFIGLPRIYIYGEREDGNGNTFLRTSEDLYSTTIHEIAHAMHQQMPTSFKQTEVLLLESWAVAVEWNFLRRRYAGIPGSEFWGSEQDVDRFDDQIVNWQDVQGYSPLLVDLMDDYDQRAFYGLNDCSVSGGAAVTNSNRARRACLIFTASQGVNMFLWQGGVYTTSNASGSCPVGTQGPQGNCYIMPIPNNDGLWMEGSKLYAAREGDNDFPRDIVSGYSLWALQQAMKVSEDRTQFKNAIRGQFWNPGEGAELDILFDNYNHVPVRDLWDVIGSHIQISG